MGRESVGGGGCDSFAVGREHGRFLDSRKPFPVFAAGFVEGGCLFLLFCGWETQPHGKKPPARPDVCLFCPLFAGT